MTLSSESAFDRICKLNTAISQKQNRNPIWHRSELPRPFQLQERDLEILRVVFLHRFLKPSHVHILLGGSYANLARRCRLLWQHRYLERPIALRPLKVLTEEIVYGLGPAGAGLLEHSDNRLEIAKLDWAATPKRQVGWPYIDHQLGISTFFVLLKKACLVRGIELRWDGHMNCRKYLLKSPGGSVVQPDGYFVLRQSKNQVLNNFLEFDRGSVSLNRMQERYRTYFEWWKHLRSKPLRSQRRFGNDLKHVRVLTITTDPSHVDSLRSAALPVGQDRNYKSTWKALLFTDSSALDLSQPERLFDRVFRFADELHPTSLLLNQEH